MKDDTMTIRIPKGIKKKIVSRAQREKRTIANEAIYLMEKALESLEHKKEAVHAGHEN